MHLPIVFLSKLLVAEATNMLLYLKVYLLNMFVTIANLAKFHSAPMRTRKWLFLAMRPNMVVHFAQGRDQSLTLRIALVKPIVSFAVLICHFKLEYGKIRARGNLSFVLQVSWIKVHAFHDFDLPVNLDTKFSGYSLNEFLTEYIFETMKL